MENQSQMMCSTPGCGQASKMQCPTCIKLNLTPSFFCSQECFKNYWPIHKFYHKKPETNTKSQDKYQYTGPLRPGKVSPKLFVPETIKRPDYAYTGTPTEEIQSQYQRIVEVKSKEDVDKLREACLLGRKILDYSHTLIKANVTTDEIDKKVHQFHIENNAYPAPLNYHKFPKSLCTSINEVICHGIPDDRPLENGDIINCDITPYLNGFNGDLNETFFVGEVSDSSKFLVKKAYECLEKAIEICKPGVMYRDIGNLIGKFIEENGLSVVRSYTGHGIGKLFHCAPNVPHYRGNKAVGFMKAGHVFTIEPMINQGTWKDVLWNDEWTAVTADGQRSAQFEHTLLVTEGGVEVLTARLPTSPELFQPCF